MAIVNSLPLTAKFNNADSTRDGLMSKEDKLKLDNIAKSFNYEFTLSPSDWSEYEDGYIAHVAIENFNSEMYVVLLPQSSCTKEEYFAIAESELNVRNSGDGRIEITSALMPRVDYKLTAIYSSNAVMIPVPNVYQDTNAIYEFTLRAADWTGEGVPYLQTIPVNGFTRTMHGAVSLVDDCSQQELRAAILGKFDIEHIDNLLTVIANGEKPTIDIRCYIIYGNNLAMSFYPVGNIDGLAEADAIVFDNSSIGMDESPKNVHEALSVIWNRMVRITDGAFDRNQLLEIKVGTQLFDTILGKPVWCKSTNPYVFVDAMGNAVYEVE